MLRLGLMSIHSVLTHTITKIMLKIHIDAIYLDPHSPTQSSLLFVLASSALAILFARSTIE